MSIYLFINTNANTHMQQTRDHFKRQKYKDPKIICITNLL